MNSRNWVERLDKLPDDSPPNFLPLIWTYPDGARQLRRVAPRRRAPRSLLIVATPYVRIHVHIRSVAFECHFSNLKNSIDYLVLYVSFDTFRLKETNEIEHGK